MKHKLITPPSVEPVTLAEAKAHMRIDSSTDDTYINTLITASREYCETYQNRVYCTQTWEVALDEFNMDGIIELHKSPLQSVTSLKYYDADDTEYTFDPSNYYVDTYATKGAISLNYWDAFPTNILRPKNSVIVRYVAGHGVAANVPTKVKQAILLLITHWYENREPVCASMKTGEAMQFTIEAILNQDRLYEV